METKKCLEALDTVMSKRYSSREYNIGGYQEESICIQNEKDGWSVYNGERGNRYNEVKCKTVLIACLTFIHKTTSKIDVLSEMENEFLSIITKVA